MQIACSNCGNTRLVDVDLQRHVARCATCNAIFDTSAHHGGEALVPGRRRAPVKLPASIRVVEVPSGDFTIERDWFATSHVVMALLCVAWVWVALHFHVVVPPAFSVVIGSVLLYATVAGFVNRTTITVHGGALSVRHGPLPWRGSCSVPTADLTQLFCREDVTTTRNGTQTAYSVHATRKSGPALQLLSELPDPGQALFIEEAIETRLGIVDVAMAGELPP